MTAWPVVPLINTPVPVPGWPPNSTLMRPRVGHDQAGGGCAGIFGSAFGLGAGRDDALAVPDGGRKRICCPG